MLKTKKAGFHRKVRFPPAFIIQRTIFEHSRHVLSDAEKSKAFRSRTWATYDLERPRIFRKLHVFIFYVTINIYDVRDLLTLEIKLTVR